MIIGIEGGIGAGKTLVMTHFLVQEAVEMKRPVMANYHISHIPNFRYTTFADFLQMAQEDRSFARVAFGLDEAHVWMDSRTAASKLNRLMTYWTLQTGKEDINLYYTTQDFGQVDKRLRQRTDIAVHVKKRKGNMHLLTIVDRTANDRVSRALIDGSQVWDFYDTREVVKVANPSRNVA